MIVVYKPMSTEQILESAQKAVYQIEEWFKANPKRRVCNVEIWYGKAYKIKRKNVTAQVTALAEVLIAKQG